MLLLSPFLLATRLLLKKRPAVLISSDAYNNISSDIVIMAITSQTEKTIGIGECLIADWQNAGLLKPSAVKPAISTIEQTLVSKKLGKLSLQDSISMDAALKELLAIKAK